MSICFSFQEKKKGFIHKEFCGVFLHGVHLLPSCKRGVCIMILCIEFIERANFTRDDSLLLVVTIADDSKKLITKFIMCLNVYVDQ